MGIEQTFREVLDQPDLTLMRSSNADTVEDWDSMAHIRLVTAIQRQYRIKFALGELQDLKNVGDLVDLVHEKLSARAVHG